MTVRNLLTANAIYVGLLVLAALFATANLLELNGLEVNKFTLGLQRFIGAASVGYLVTSWLMRNTAASGARRAFLIGAGVGYIVILVVMIINFNAVFGLANAGIRLVYLVINALFAAAFLYFARQEPITE